MRLKHCKTVSLICASETLLNLFFFLQLDEVRQLLLGQRTGNTTQLVAGSEDCRTHFTAEHIKTEDSLSPRLLENSSVETPFKWLHSFRAMRKMWGARKTKGEFSFGVHPHSLVALALFWDSCRSELKLRHVIRDQGSASDCTMPTLCMFQFNRRAHFYQLHINHYFVQRITPSTSACSQRWFLK